MEANPEVLFSLERIFLFGGAFIRTVDDSEYLGLVLFVMFCCTVIADQIYCFKETGNFITLPIEERKQLLPIYQVVSFAYDFEMLVAMLVLVVVPLELWMGWYVMRHIALRFLLLIALTATSTVQFMVLLTELITPLMQSSNAEMIKQTADELKRVEKPNAELEEKYAAISLELSTTKSQCQRLQDEHTKCESSRRLLLDILKYKNSKIQELGEKLEALRFELSMMKSRCQLSDHGECMEERWQLQLKLKNRDDELLERNTELEHTCAALSSSELSITKSECKTAEQTVEEDHVDEMNEDEGVDKTQEVKEAVAEVDDKYAELSQSVEAAGHRKCEEGRQQFLDEQLNKQGEEVNSTKAEFHERFAALCSKVNGSTTSVGKNDRYYRTSSSR